jgi:hypothetical protein
MSNIFSGAISSGFAQGAQQAWENQRQAAQDKINAQLKQQEIENNRLQLQAYLQNMQTQNNYYHALAGTPPKGLNIEAPAPGTEPGYIQQPQVQSNGQGFTIPPPPSQTPAPGQPSQPMQPAGMMQPSPIMRQSVPNAQMMTGRPDLPYAPQQAYRAIPSQPLVGGNGPMAPYSEAAALQNPQGYQFNPSQFRLPPKPVTQAPPMQRQGGIPPTLPNSSLQGSPQSGPSAAPMSQGPTAQTMGMGQQQAPQSQAIPEDLTQKTDEQIRNDGWTLVAADRLKNPDKYPDQDSMATAVGHYFEMAKVQQAKQVEEQAKVIGMRKTEAEIKKIENPPPTGEMVEVDRHAELEAKQASGETLTKKEQYELSDLTKRLNKKDYIRPVTNINIGGVGGGLSSDAREMMAQAYAHGDVQVLSGLGWGNASAQMKKGIINRAAEIQKEEGGGNLAGAQAGYKANSMALNQVTKDLTAIKPYKGMLDINGDIAIDLSKKVMRTNSALANKSLNWIKQNMGDNPDTAEFLFQMNTLQTEGARVLSNPRLVGQLSDQARQDMQSVINGNMTLNATERVIRRMQKDGSYRVQQMEKQAKDLQSSLSGKQQQSGQTTAFKKLPSGVKLSPGMHVDKNGHKFEVFQDGTYQDR